MMNIHQLKKTFYKTLFPPKFGNKKIQSLYNFVSQNDSDTEYWTIDGQLQEFIGIIKSFDESDIQYFFERISLWNSYYLVIISDKFLDSHVRANIKYDLGKIYAKIFLLYEDSDPYFLIDNLEIAVTMYESKIDTATLIDLTSKIEFMHHKKLITRQQRNHNIHFINSLTDELSN
ncbi:MULTISPECIES: hypothetical protein [unclassified Chryseobacterium]|uniref:hypothetical protein n=1 Tax=unclassified Chryseobacterium TaxID=2593645 RepID=UPI000645E93B|nr:MULTISPECIES: hypothetical protein [unclassified Chryseobacterium]SHF52824.1 hypothetical protein SAMN02787100_2266 [Chryseobacterium sp. OV279]HCA08409.1 hypothetical protein [Chryseobacterium sp.]